ncbi:MAG: hypothetical protein NZ908_02875 [Candidatus Micrarchaeota archaeon]|nr:hypothetical protein [Candidatus Micrarchaeota archaeon]MCX8154393.1 hypothetical protein [Candidatus Micrarchaeota archaeon]
MHSVEKYSDTPRHWISRSLHDRIRSSSRMDRDNVNEIGKIWSDLYGRKEILDMFFDLYEQTEQFNDFNANIKLGLLPRPHMEGMIDMFIGNRDFGKILRIPLSIYRHNGKYLLLVHTVQGYVMVSDINKRILENSIGNKIAYASLAVMVFESIGKKFSLAFQHPNDNYWHHSEMIRRNRKDTSRKFSIYENVIRKILGSKNTQGLNNIRELYNLLESIEYMYVKSIDYIYLPFPNISIDYHPTYFNTNPKTICDGEIECERYPISEFSIRPIKSTNDIMVNTRYFILLEPQQGRS